MTPQLSVDNKLLSSKVIICDIEGTTSSISFVKDTLFPYALENIDQYLNENWDTDNIKSAIFDIKRQSTDDLKADVDGAFEIVKDDKEKNEQITSIVQNVKWMMNNDRKVSALKNLQGMIWEKGYKEGTIKGHVFEDVPKAFENWIKNGKKICIYSSGSVQAQKLLFENTKFGSLLPYISNYYDTNIGLKQCKDSYKSIIDDLKVPGEEILFLTDIVKEAEAAKSTGINVILLNREGNAPFTDEEKQLYPIVSSFNDLMYENQNATTKRKINPEEENSVEERPTKLSKIENEEDKSDINTSINGNEKLPTIEEDQEMKSNSDEIKTVDEKKDDKLEIDEIKKDDLVDEKMEVDGNDESEKCDIKKSSSSDEVKETIELNKTETKTEEIQNIVDDDKTKTENIKESDEISEIKKEITEIEKTTEKFLELVPNTLADDVSTNVPIDENKTEQKEEVKDKDVEKTIIIEVQTDNTTLEELKKIEETGKKINDEDKKTDVETKVVEQLENNKEEITKESKDESKETKTDDKTIETKLNDDNKAVIDGEDDKELKKEEKIDEKSEMEVDEKKETTEDIKVDDKKTESQDIETTDSSLKETSESEIKKDDVEIKKPIEEEKLNGNNEESKTVTITNGNSKDKIETNGENKEIVVEKNGTVSKSNENGDKKNGSDETKTETDSDKENDTVNSENAEKTDTDNSTTTTDSSTTVKKLKETIASTLQQPVPVETET